MSLARVPVVELAEDALDLLAVWFTIVKAVHALGVLSVLPALIQIIGGWAASQQAVPLTPMPSFLPQ